MSDLAPIPEATAKNAVAASHLGSNSPDVVSTSFDEAAALESPPVRKFRVETEKNISHNGIRSILRQGKEIDENNYDIAALLKQGVKLVEIHPEG